MSCPVGQRPKRVMIAMAPGQRARNFLLIADEPTTDWTSRFQLEILEAAQVPAGKSSACAAADQPRSEPECVELRTGYLCSVSGLRRRREDLANTVRPTPARSNQRFDRG